MKKLIVALILALSCSAPDKAERIYISGLEPCDPGGQSGGGQGGQLAGDGGQSGGQGGQGGHGPDCGIDDPIAIAEAAGLTVKLYYIADDPNITVVSGVSNWPDRKNGFPLLQTNTSWQPALLGSDTTLGNRASVTCDGVDDRIIENTWNGPGSPSATNPWGFIQLSVKYVAWHRARQGWGSQVLPTRGVHTGETRSWRHDNGGAPIIITAHSADGEWTRTIHQFSGTGVDWACAGATCQTKTNTGGSATSASRALCGCTNSGWDPIPAGGNQPPPAIQHDQGNCFTNAAHGAILQWSGYLSQSQYNIWNDWIDCWYGSGTVALN